MIISLKNYEKNARKNICGEWGLNPQPLEWMRVRRKIKKKINVESGD